VRRQAATALGQIGDKSAVAALLTAAQATEDRFTRHAIIYALVLLKDESTVKKSLVDSRPLVQDAALIALDQMNSPELRASDVTGFLTGNNERLRNTALWVASHHADWSDEMIGILRSRFGKGVLNQVEEKLYRELLVSFCEKADMQQFIAAGATSGSTEYRLFFLDAMGKCKLKEFPGVWTEQLGRLLGYSTEPAVKAAAMQVVSLRGITSLTESLRKVANDKNNPSFLRIDAIAQLHKSQPELSDQEFEYLYTLLRTEKEAPLRQHAAYALAQAKLSEEQLKKLTDEYLPKADAFILPHLVPLYAGAHSSSIGNALVAALMESKALDGFSVEGLEKTFEKYPADVKPAVDRLMTKLKEVHGERLQRLQGFESQIGKGSLDNGRRLFLGKATCVTCHTVGSQGGSFGPDLTSIQRDRSAHDLLEAIVYPGSSFVREFETYVVKTKTSEYRGMVREKGLDALRIDTAPGNSVRIPNKGIVSIEMDNTSMMPQGLDKLLSEQEMADLMTFLLGQDQDPETDQKILRR
jgi:putative heme-binding domain-containing protein